MQLEGVRGGEPTTRHRSSGGFGEGATVSRSRSVTSICVQSHPGPQERTGCTLGEPLALHLEELQMVPGPGLGGNGSHGSVLNWMLSERTPHTYSHK